MADEDAEQVEGGGFKGGLAPKEQGGRWSGVTDEQKHAEEEQPEAAQADLEVADEDAEQVEGGAVRYNAPKPQPLKRG